MSGPEPTDDDLRALGYAVRHDDEAGWYVLDTPRARAIYGSHTPDSLWALARRLERAAAIT